MEIVRLIKVFVRTLPIFFLYTTSHDLLYRYRMYDTPDTNSKITYKVRLTKYIAGTTGTTGVPNFTPSRVCENGVGNDTPPSPPVPNNKLNEPFDVEVEKIPF